MGLSNRDIVSMDRYAASMDAYTKAVESEAGKDLRRERIALEEAAGGAEKLKQADAVLAEAKSKAEEIVREANVKAGQSLASVEKARQSFLDLKERAERDLSAREAAAKALDEETKQRAGAADSRETALKKRETEAEVAEKANERRSSDLDRRQADLDKRQATLDARDRAVKAAMETA